MNAARFAALSAALLLPVSAASLGAADPGPDSTHIVSADEPSAKAPKVSKKAKSISIRLLPQIAQPSRRVASPANAKIVVLTTVTPKRRTSVTLQVKAGKKWKKVSSATTGRNGQHVFLAAPKQRGKSASYRVRVGKRASKPASTSRWLKPSFSDAFNGTALGKGWNHRSTDYNTTTRKCSRGDSRAVRVQDGTVRLSVLKDPSRQDKCTAMRAGKSTGKYAYRLNGHIGTQSSYAFTYGFAAARVKFPKESGQHAAFWLQVDKPDLRTINPKINGSEIDVIESYGMNAGNVDKSLGLTTGVQRYSTLNGKTVTHPDGGWVKNSAQYLTGKKDSFDGAYHVFSVEWSPEYYIYRVDGKEYWRTHKGISGTAQFPVLSILSSDYEIYRLKGDTKKLPQHMYVDWLQVWETHP